MTKQFEIYITDLTKEAQEELLKVAGVQSPEETNWDVFPIAIVEFEEDEDE